MRRYATMRGETEVLWRPREEGFTALARKQPWNLRLNPPFPASGGREIDGGKAGKLWMSDTLFAMCFERSGPFSKDCQDAYKDFLKRQSKAKRERRKTQMREHPELYPEQTGFESFEEFEFDTKAAPPAGGLPQWVIPVGVGALLLGAAAIVATAPGDDE